MKTMTCKQLGGACDLAFHANTFEEMAELSHQHGIAMKKKNDPEHLKAMEKMQTLMNSPEAMDEWFETKRKAFDALPPD